MIVSRIVLRNWRNFREADVTLGSRAFLVGPNASGKSNFLDAFRFLRDIARDGLEKAVGDRGGISKIRCLAARRQPNIELEITLAESQAPEPAWKYSLCIKQQERGLHLPYVGYERVWQGSKQLVDRPNEQDRNDFLLLTQTHLEQINANQSFRAIAGFLESVLYLHLIPQLVRNPQAFSGPGVEGDPFGRNFLERIAKTPERTRRSRLKRIEEALRIAVPQLKNLTETKDEAGIPHLEAIYEHWRPKGAKQREDQFSDGTLRLLGLLWSLLESDSLLLLEEPELSLNTGIVTELPALLHRLQRHRRRQIILSTHSADLLTDKGIAGEEVILLTPYSEGTKVELASSIQEVRDLLEGGLSVADAVMPRTVPGNVHQLDLKFFR